MCGADNQPASRELHGPLLMLFLVRQKSAETLGQQQKAAIALYVIDRLKKSFLTWRRTGRGSDGLGR